MPCIKVYGFNRHMASHIFNGALPCAAASVGLAPVDSRQIRWAKAPWSLGGVRGGDWQAPTRSCPPSRHPPMLALPSPSVLLVPMVDDLHDPRLIVRGITRCHDETPRNWGVLPLWPPSQGQHRASPRGGPFAGRVPDRQHRRPRVSNAWQGSMCRQRHAPSSARRLRCRAAPAK